MIQMKSVFDSPHADDGHRIFVEGAWPKGVTRTGASIDLWLREVAPSRALMAWYGAEPARWDEFKDRYGAELDAKERHLDELKRLESVHGTITLLISARDPRHSSGMALLEHLALHQGFVPLETVRPPVRRR